MSDSDRKAAKADGDPVEVEVEDGDGVTPGASDETEVDTDPEAVESTDVDSDGDTDSDQEDDAPPHVHAEAEVAEDPADRSDEEDAALDAELEELREASKRLEDEASEGDDEDEVVIAEVIVDEDDGTPPSAAEEGELDAVDFLEKQLEAARAELSAMSKDLDEARKLSAQKDATRARLQADFDNYRKRQERDIERLQEQRVEKLLLKVLPVYDTFGRAIDQYEKDNSEDALYTGLQMIEKMFQQFLELQGITPMEAVGKPFDPNLHDAVCRVEIPEDGFDDMVVDVFETGYIFKEKVLKPAKVSVAKD